MRIHPLLYRAGVTLVVALTCVLLLAALVVGWKLDPNTCDLQIPIGVSSWSYESSWWPPGRVCIYWPNDASPQFHFRRAMHSRSRWRPALCAASCWCGCSVDGTNGALGVGISTKRAMLSSSEDIQLKCQLKQYECSGRAPWTHQESGASSSHVQVSDQLERCPGPPGAIHPDVSSTWRFV